MVLFGKKKKEPKSALPQTPVSQNETTYFGKNLQIKGRVSGNGNLIILGTLDGEFNLKGRLKIAQPAKIKGEIKADAISVNGNVKGSLIGNERVHLEQTARIEGRIHTPKLSIDEGAFFDGEINMSGIATKPEKAPDPISVQRSEGSSASTEKKATS